MRLLSLAFSIVLMAAAAAPLHPGDALPALHGETLSGKPVELPAVGAGRTRVLVFSFTKAAGADSRLWNDRLAKDLGPTGPVIAFRVIELQSVPRLFRQMAVSGIKGGMPQALWDQTILSYKDEAFWKDRLGVTEDRHSHVVLLDAEGHIRWMGSGPYSESGYQQLSAALRATIANNLPK
jgi:hypothetical protein